MPLIPASITPGVLAVVKPTPSAFGEYVVVHSVGSTERASSHDAAGAYVEDVAVIGDSEISFGADGGGLLVGAFLVPPKLSFDSSVVYQSWNLGINAVTSYTDGRSALALSFGPWEHAGAVWWISHIQEAGGDTIELWSAPSNLSSPAAVASLFTDASSYPPGAVERDLSAGDAYPISGTGLVWHTVETFRDSGGSPVGSPSQLRVTLAWAGPISEAATGAPGFYRHGVEDPLDSSRGLAGDRVSSGARDLLGLDATETPTTLWTDHMSVDGLHANLDRRADGQVLAFNLQTTFPTAPNNLSVGSTASAPSNLTIASHPSGGSLRHCYFGDD